MEITMADRLAGGIVGHLVGDALGVPYEFREPDAIGNVRWGERGSHRQPPGTWSDDGALMLARTDHVYGSSLGPAIAVAIICRMGLPAEAYEHFMRAARADLHDVRGNAGDGIHGASAGGIWQALVFGFAGLRINDTGWTIEPRLPEGWTRLAFRFSYRGELQRVEIEAGETGVRLGWRPRTRPGPGRASPATGTGRPSDRRATRRVNQTTQMWWHQPRGRASLDPRRVDDRVSVPTAREEWGVWTWNDRSN